MHSDYYPQKYISRSVITVVLYVTEKSSKLRLEAIAPPISERLKGLLHLIALPPIIQEHLLVLYIESVSHSYQTDSEVNTTLF